MKAKQVLIGFLVAMYSMLSYSFPNYGSNTASSRQQKVFFPMSDTNNMDGFSVFEKGFVFQDALTTCTYDAFFPVSGNLAFNGGSLYLKRDIELKSPITIGAGNIYGDDFAVMFPQNISNLSVPTEYHEKLLTFLDQESLTGQIISMDWSYDDKYLAIATNRASGSGEELKLFYVMDNTLTLTASYNAGNYSLYCVRWHPSEYYLATGQNSGVEFNIFKWDPSDGSLGITDSADIGLTYAVAWHPSGNYVTASGYSNAIKTYDFANGTLSTLRTATFATSRFVYFDALDWDVTGSYLAAGLNPVGNDTEIQVFHFDGETFNLNAQAELGTYAYSLSWSPVGGWLAIGKISGNERIEVFKHDPIAGTLESKALGGSNKNVYGLDWHPEGKYLAIARQLGSDNMEVRVLCFDDVNLVLNTVTGYKKTMHVRTVRWSHDGKKLASGDLRYQADLYSFTDGSMVFNNVRLFFGSDIVFRTPVRFQGECVINCAGYAINFTDKGSIILDAGATLLVENTVIKDVSANKITCVDDDCVLVLRDVNWVQDSDFIFAKGSIQLQDNVKMSGNAVFAYQSKQTSTLLTKSNLELDVGFTFSYDPTVMESKNLFECIDDTSVIRLEGATLHTTVTGWQFKKGKIFVGRDSFISSEVEKIDGRITKDNGILFGDNNIADDCKVEIFSGATLHCLQGSIYYHNVSANSWKMYTNSSVLRMYADTRINLYESLNLDQGIMILENNVIVAHGINKKIIGSIHPLGKYVNTIIPENKELNLFD